MHLCEQKECTDCGVCEAVCSKKAIKTLTNIDGSVSRYIDSNICVNCGRCVAVCPILNKVDLLYPQKCVAAQVNNPKLHYGSSSGAIAYALGRKVIEEGGVVFGAYFNDDKGLVVDRADKLELLEKTRGSKYVKAITTNSYSYIQSSLKQGKRVMVTGTPCFIAAVRNFLGDKYDNVLLVDIICHGTPPQKMFLDYCNYVCNGKPFNSISFRNRNEFKLTLKNNRKVVYSKSKNEDPYLKAFMDGMTYGEKCYSCPYACSSRVGDITLGDFWGLDTSSLINEYRPGVSVVLINSNNGKAAFDSITNMLSYEYRSIEEAISGNDQLRHPSKRNGKRDLYLQGISEKGCLLSLIDNTELIKDPSYIHNLLIRFKSKVRSFL